MRLLSDHNEEMNAQKKTTLVKKNFDSNASSNSSKTRKESIKDGGIEEEEDDDDDELVAKTSYVLDVASLEESDALKIARLRERQQKDFEIERLKRIVKMLCEQKTNAERRRKDEYATRNAPGSCRHSDAATIAETGRDFGMRGGTCSSDACNQLEHSARGAVHAFHGRPSPRDGRRAAAAPG